MDLEKQIEKREQDMKETEKAPGSAAPACSRSLTRAQRSVVLHMTWFSQQQNRHGSIWHSKQTGAWSNPELTNAMSRMWCFLKKGEPQNGWFMCWFITLKG